MPQNDGALRTLPHLLTSQAISQAISFSNWQFCSFYDPEESDLINRLVIGGLQRQVHLGENAPKLGCPENPPPTFSLLGPYLPNDDDVLY